MKTGLPTKFSFVAYDCLILVFSCCLLNPENHMEIWLVILFLPRKKFHAQQVVVLTGFMKLGPCLLIPGSYGDLEVWYLAIFTSHEVRWSDGLDFTRDPTLIEFQ